MTAQLGEALIIDGTDTCMTFVPPVKGKHPRIVLNTDQNDLEAAMYRGCTACWRQYVGTWEIRDGHFYLRKLVGKYRLLGDETLLADWFSGELCVPQGECL